MTSRIVSKSLTWPRLGDSQRILTCTHVCLRLRSNITWPVAQHRWYNTKDQPHLELGQPTVEKKYSSRKFPSEARSLIEKSKNTHGRSDGKWAPQKTIESAGKDMTTLSRPAQPWATKERDNYQNPMPPKAPHRQNGRINQADKDRRNSVEQRAEDSDRKPRVSGRRTRDPEHHEENVSEIEQPKPKKRPSTLVPKKLQREVYIPDMITTANLAKVLNVRIENLTQKMARLGMTNTNHDFLLTADDASLLALEYDINPIVDNQSALDLYSRLTPADKSVFPPRPPIVTIMGHVDHGKTTLLDTLRKTSVAAGEAGGITQHIGAFSVKLPSGQRITFLDTPGHAAFTAMRSRGARVTDIVVLVVAADDGVMPQTLEAIKHAKDAGVPIIVAVNKCDKHGANPKKTKNSLVQHGLMLEEASGDVQAVEVSGMTGHGLNDLEEAIVTLAEVLDIRAEVDGESEGVVLESQTEKGRGHVATVLIQRGTLRLGAFVVAGTAWAKVRIMTDEAGRPVKEALPGMPVKVVGWRDLPMAGDEMLEAKDESLAKTVVNNRVIKCQREQQLKDLEVINEKRRVHHEEDTAQKDAERVRKKQVYLFHQGMLNKFPAELELPERMAENISKDDRKELRVVVKGDVSGTVEAITASLEGLQNKEVRVDIVHFGVGDVAPSDVQLASSAGGMIIGFNVKVDKKIQNDANQANVPLKTYTVIYNLLDDIKIQLAALLPPLIETHVNGEAVVQQLFEISVKGRGAKVIAGCRITNGIVSRKGLVRIMRDKKQIWEGNLEMLKHVKTEITEAKKGLECGMLFDGFGDFKEGDIIQSIEHIETPRTL